MADTTARVLALLQCLHAQRFWTGEALAQELGVTARCVRKDVQRLRDLGYPVHASAGVGGGYSLGAGDTMPPLPLDADEALAVALGLRAAAAGEVRGLEEPAVRALAKLEVVLPVHLRRRLSDLQVVTASFGRMARVDAAVLAELARACREPLEVRFRYTARRGEASKRRVQPHRLVHVDQRWYLLAWDLRREDWRTFRVDRVAAPTTGERFTPREPPDADAARFVARSVTTGGFAVQARLLVHAPAEAVAAKIGSYGWVEPCDAERCWLEIGGDDPVEMARWLVLLGWPLSEVIPVALRDAFRAIARELASAYGAPEGER